MSWIENKTWSDRFIPEIKRILGDVFFDVAQPIEDQLFATDLILRTKNDIRIACRVRKYEYWQRYPDEFTIRSYLPSGMPTELTKIMNGYGDYLFYGFADSKETTLLAWTLGDLTVFRSWMTENWHRYSMIHGTERCNFDGKRFYVFDIKRLPPEFIVRQYRPIFS
jgi:hypothetical protein